jgi:hypothetical protein
MKTSSSSKESLFAQKADPGRNRTRVGRHTLLSATSLTRSSKETDEAYLLRVTHLHLQAKRIKIIEGLELCPKLKV